MPSVELNINGRFYSVACDPGEEDRLRQLGVVLDQKARQIGGAASDAQRFLMVSLLLADELDEARAKNGGGNSAAQGETDTDLLVAAVDHLAERIDQIAASLAQV